MKSVCFGAIHEGLAPSQKPGSAAACLRCILGAVGLKSDVCDVYKATLTLLCADTGDALCAGFRSELGCRLRFHNKEQLLSPLKKMPFVVTIA